MREDFLEGVSCCAMLSCSVVPNSLWSPWTVACRAPLSMKFSGQEYGVGCHSLLQGIFPTQGSNSGLLHCRWIFTSWATREAQEYWSGQPIPSPGDLPDLGIEPGSPALPADSLPAEPPGKPKNTGVGSPSLLQGTLPTRESDWGPLHHRWVFY